MDENQHTDRPWTPIQIFGTAFIFGAGAAGLISGINFRRMGKEKLLWPSIAAGLIVFLIQVWAFLSLIPEELVSAIGIPVNLAIALGFLLVQQAHFRKWKSEKWEPSMEGERYKPSRIGLLFLAGLGALLVEITIVAVLILSSGGNIQGNQFGNKLKIIKGIDIHNVYLLNLPAGISPDDYEAFCQELYASPAIIRMAGASGFIPEEPENVVLTYREQELQVKRILTEPEFPEVMQMVLIKGRIISQDDPPDQQLIVLTETVSSIIFGKENPLGNSLTIKDGSETVYEVIGIFSEIISSVDAEEPEALAFGSLNRVPGKLYIRIAQDKNNEAITHINSCWGEIAAGVEADCRPVADLY